MGACLVSSWRVMAWVVQAGHVAHAARPPRHTHAPTLQNRSFSSLPVCPLLLLGPNHQPTRSWACCRTSCRPTCAPTCASGWPRHVPRCCRRRCAQVRAPCLGRRQQPVPHSSPDLCTVPRRPSRLPLVTRPGVLLIEPGSAPACSYVCGAYALRAHVPRPPQAVCRWWWTWRCCRAPRAPALWLRARPRAPTPRARTWPRCSSRRAMPTRPPPTCSGCWASG